MSGEEMRTKEKRLYCSFCGLSDVELGLNVLIATLEVCICDRCVGICRDILWQHRHNQWIKFKDLAP